MILTSDRCPYMFMSRCCKQRNKPYTGKQCDGSRKCGDPPPYKESVLKQGDIRIERLYDIYANIQDRCEHAMRLLEDGVLSMDDFSQFVPQIRQEVKRLMPAYMATLASKEKEKE